MGENCVTIFTYFPLIYLLFYVHVDMFLKCTDLSLLCFKPWTSYGAMLRYVFYTNKFILFASLAKHLG